MCSMLHAQKPWIVDPLWLGLDSSPRPLDLPQTSALWSPTNGLGVEVGSPQGTWVCMLGPEATSCLFLDLALGSGSRGLGSMSGLGFPVSLPPLYGFTGSFSMFPLLRPLVGTKTEINPARLPSQKPGI